MHRGNAAKKVVGEKNMGKRKKEQGSIERRDEKHARSALRQS